MAWNTQGNTAKLVMHNMHSTKKPVTTMLTYPWKCTVLHCNHVGNTWKPLVLMTRHFDYCPSASVRSSAPVVSRCFPRGYNVKLYISRGRLAWWLLAFLHSMTLERSTIKLITLLDTKWPTKKTNTEVEHHKRKTKWLITDATLLFEI